VVRAGAAVTRAAFRHRVNEPGHVSGSFPCFGVKNNRRVQADHVAPFAHKNAPPFFLNIALELNASRSIFIRIRQAAINLRSGKDKSAPFGERNYFFHQVVFFLFVFWFRRRVIFSHDQLNND